MISMRRAFAALIIISALAVGFLTGCPKATESDQATGPVVIPGEASAKSKLTLWTIWNAEPRKSALDAIVDEFENQYPNIDVQVSNLEPDAYKTRIRIALGGNNPPDIYFTWSGEKMLHNFVRGGRTADITQYINADEGAFRKQIIPAALDRFTFDEKVYGIPYLMQSTFFFYNTEMFAKHGWKIPETWEQLITLCKQIKAAGITPVALGNMQKWPAHHFPFVITQRLLGREASEAQYDPLGPGDYSAPEFLTALNMFKKFADAGFFNKSPNGTTRENARALFYSGKAAMFYTGTWDFARFTKDGEAPEDFWGKWDFFNFPSITGGRGDQQAIAGAPDGYVISSSSPHVAEAAQFLKFMTSKEQAAKFAAKCQELVQVPSAVTAENAGPYLAKYAKMAEEAQTITPWMDTMMTRIVAEEYMNGVQALLDGTMSPEQIIVAVRETQAQAKKDILAAKDGADID